MRPSLGRFVAAALLGSAIPASVHAQTLTSARQELSAALADTEGNLTTAEAIGMNFKDWQSRYDSHKAQLDDLNARVGQFNSYCQGTYEHDEYVRRKAQCDSLGSQLDTLQTQLEPERTNLDEQLRKLKQRTIDAKQAMGVIQAHLTTGLQHLTFACATLSAEEFAASCRVPTAPGPRTAPMVAQMNADIAGRKP